MQKATRFVTAITRNSRATVLRTLRSTKVTIKKLDKKETYWVKARAYKVVNGSKKYGAWSKVKKSKKSKNKK